MTCSNSKLLKFAIITALLACGLPSANATSAQIKFRGVVTGKPNQPTHAVTTTAVSFTDKAAFKMRSVNQQSNTVSVRFETYDGHSKPLDSVIHPQKLRLAPGKSAISTVIVPLDEIGISTIRICSIHLDRTGTVINRICGDYTAKRIALSE